MEKASMSFETSLCEAEKKLSDMSISPISNSPKGEINASSDLQKCFQIPADCSVYSMFDSVVLKSGIALG
ncbi:hypothetical protein C0J52_09768 [Blattella germanica]|nr:hypothetical protein C0J52_09768 [Blattella germanica]